MTPNFRKTRINYKTGSLISYFQLFVITVIPKLLPVSFGEEPLNSGQVVIVPCAVTEGDPPLKLRWTLNNHSISPHSGVAILDLGGRGAILSIGSVQATHAGTYTCIAENLAGRHELSADLIVNGVIYLKKTEKKKNQYLKKATTKLSSIVPIIFL